MSQRDLGFSFADAAALTSADAKTLENWKRYEHISPATFPNGRKGFTFWQLAEIEVMALLGRVLHMYPRASKHVARVAVDAFRAGSENAGWVISVDGEFSPMPDDPPPDAIAVGFPIDLLVERLDKRAAEQKVIQARVVKRGFDVSDDA